MNIWNILGIQPTDSIDDIRAAYSEKIKQHHPEDDPEGFARLRDAYKLAIRIASIKPAEETPSPMRTRDDAAKLSVREVPAFDFSDPEKFTPAQVERAEQEKKAADAFDFSDLEKLAIAQTARDEQEEKIADDIVKRAKDLYKSRKRGNHKAWEELLSNPELGRLKNSEYFIWAFLDFLAMSPGISEKIHVRLLDPFLLKCRDHWQGTILWGEFDVATQKLAASKYEMAFRLREVQVLSPFIAIIAGLLIMGVAYIVAPEESGRAEGFLQARYFMDAATLIVVPTVAAVVILIQIFCLTRVRMLSARSASSTPVLHNSKRIFTIAIAAALFFCYIFISSKPGSMARASADLAQIADGNLITDVVYVVYIKYDTDARIIVVSTENATDPIFNPKTSILNNSYSVRVPLLFFFDPEPNALAGANISFGIEESLARGMKVYRIAYTDNYNILVSITEVQATADSGSTDSGAPE